MPSKNTLKTYIEDSYYHLFNRGVEKRSIFLDQQDYDTFLSYLREYLQPRDYKTIDRKLSAPDLKWRDRAKILNTLRISNFNDEISLLAYALMPNHFHLLIRQKNAVSIDRFMRSLCTRYVLYFNGKYQRVGPLFQGVYKAVLVENETQFLHLSRYIHAQALAIAEPDTKFAQPSSYPEYIGQRKTTWVHPGEVLSFFSNSFPALSYTQFVSDYRNIDSEDL